MARGGFSGGVAFDLSGMAIALVTESLGRYEAPVESGYMSLLSIASAVDLPAEAFGFSALIWIGCGELGSNAFVSLRGQTERSDPTG